MINQSAQSHTRYSDAAISNTIVNARIRYGNLSPSGVMVEIVDRIGPTLMAWYEPSYNFTNRQTTHCTQRSIQESVNQNGVGRSARCSSLLYWTLTPARTEHATSKATKRWSALTCLVSIMFYRKTRFCVIQSDIRVRAKFHQASAAVRVLTEKHRQTDKETYRQCWKQYCRL